MDYLSKKIEREKTQSTFMNNLQDRASLLAAIEAKRSRKLFRELIIHLLFFILLIVILFLQRDVQACHDIQTGVSISLFTNQIEHDLQPFSKTYTDVGQWEEYRDYLVGLFAPALTATEDYASNNLTGEELYNVEYVNKVVGAVRFRQLRVRNDSCEVAGPFRSVVTSCYAVRYNKETRDEEPFGPAHNTSKYTFTEDSGGVSYYAHTNLGFWDQSGYVVDIPVDENFSEAINELIADDFFGAATRAIIIQVNLLSVNYDNRVTNLLLLSEFSAAGLVSPFYSFRTFRIYMYSDALDSFRAFLEITFVIFLIYYIYASIRQWVVDYKVGRVKEYITDLWNITEVANLVLFFIATVMYLKYLGSDREGIDLSDRSDYVVEMEHFASDAIQFYQIAAINILLSAFKTFKYLKLNPRLYVLWETLYGARVDMATYMIMFLIILLGFLFFGWLTFGSDLEAFNGFSSSLGTLWQFLIGNPPEYDDLASANRVLGPLYYALFTIFVFFILVNMFVAIVSNSYETISAKVSTNSTLKVTDLKKPIQRLVKLAKVVASRKPLYSETELLTMLKNRQLLEKNVLTKQELEAELRAMGHDPLSLYIERLLSIHQKRKKFLAELIVEEKERRIEALQEAQADAGVVSEGGVSVQMEGPVDNAEDEPQDENITQLEQLEKEMARNQANRNDATNARLDAMEAKMDSLMQKLDLLLLANNAPIQMAGRSRSNTSSQRPPGFDRDRLQ